jgi:hypothetical protein
MTPSHVSKIFLILSSLLRVGFPSGLSFPHVSPPKTRISLASSPYVLRALFISVFLILIYVTVKWMCRCKSSHLKTGGNSAVEERHNWGRLCFLRNTESYFLAKKLAIFAVLEFSRSCCWRFKPYAQKMPVFLNVRNHPPYDAAPRPRGL